MVMLADRRQTGGMRFYSVLSSLCRATIHVIRPSSFIEPSHHRPVAVTRHVNSAVDRSTDCSSSSSLHSLPLSFPQTTGRFPSESVERNAEEPWHWGLASSAQFNARPVTVGRVCDSSTCGAKEGRPPGGE